MKPACIMWPLILLGYAGAYGVVWLILWTLLVADSPSEHRRISAIEREYIETSISCSDDVTQKRKVRAA